MFPDDLILNILTFLNSNDCCKHSSLFHLKSVNKYFRDIITDRKLINYHNFYQFDYNFLNIKHLCTRCDKFSDLEIEKLLKLFKNYDIYKNKKFEYFYKIHDSDKGGFHEFVHFDTKEDLNKFIDLVKSNRKIRMFFGGRCCDGKGCQVSFYSI
tara:strand:+ start:194 stop:655 length:462 start_codon:yes stop_codon:yes gene_type:complete